MNKVRYSIARICIVDLCVMIRLCTYSGANPITIVLTLKCCKSFFNSTFDIALISFFEKIETFVAQTFAKVARKKSDAYIEMRDKDIYRPGTSRLTHLFCKLQMYDLYQSNQLPINITLLHVENV